MSFENFHNLFSQNKTLRFELVPIGQTKEYFENFILKNDELRAEKFKLVKKYCDEYHRAFIDNCLKNFDSDEFVSLLEKYYLLFIKKEKDKNEESEFEKIKKKLRLIVSEKFTKSETYKKIFGKKIIDILENYYRNDKNKLDDINIFRGFVTYFTGYNDNRKNMYSVEEKHTAIAYRLIDENLPTFIKNINSFKLIQQKIPTISNDIKNNLGQDVEDLFLNIKQFSKCITQKQIETYNKIIGGISTETEKIQGINEKVNLYKQQTKEKLPLLKPLYKQILSESSSSSFLIDKIEDDFEAVSLINQLYENISLVLQKPEFIQVFADIFTYDTNRIIFDNDVKITTLSNRIFGNYNYITSLVEEDYVKNYNGKAKIGTEKYNDKKEQDLKKIKTISLARLKDLVKKYSDTEVQAKFDNLNEYFKTEVLNLINEIKTKYDACKEILQAEYNVATKELIKDDIKIEKLKNLLDSIKNLQEFVKIFISKDKTLPTDESFYNSLYYDDLCEVIGVYNKIRNYITQKPYSIEKFPLTFDCPTLADGWDKNKEKDNLCVLLMKDNNYFLGIMSKDNNKIFRDYQISDENVYKKIEYKLLPGPNKMLPKVFFSDKNIDFYNPSEEILTNYKKGCHKKGENFDLQFCHKLIDFFKDSISKHEDWKNFDFNFSDTNSYSDISAFYREVEHQGYKIKFSNVSESYINELVKDGKLFLFQIYNKDFSEHSHGKPNLHTIYFKTLFNEENLKNVVYQLNGGAEIFYRKKSLEAKITHPANIEMKNKSNTGTRTLPYDLIKDKRFTLDKFFFHVPITLNFKASGITKFNDFTNNEINKNSDNIHIIGIDRGERNLIYVSVINQNGDIVEQISLNKISNCFDEIDYHAKLDKREKENKENRRSWKKTGCIKELKEGYLSQVIHIISNLVIKYNAIIVLEDLNGGFVNSRKKVEKQVYSKFETMLVNKLAYLVDKNDKESFFNAYQLANPDIKGRQNGIIFYVPAYNTSKIDPTTGFINLFHIKKMNIDDCKNFIEKFDAIRYNKNHDYFEFDIDYRKFSDKSCGNKKTWTICTYGERIFTFINPELENHFDNKEVNLSEEFKNLFNRYQINFGNIKQEILNKVDKRFLDEFFKLFKLTTQMRNSIINSDVDYLISPVKNQKGKFFDSREKILSLPLDADANGAYNIARKGLMLLNRIKENPEKVDFKITNEDYYNYVQSRDI